MNIISRTAVGVSLFLGLAGTSSALVSDHNVIIANSSSLTIKYFSTQNGSCSVSLISSAPGNPSLYAYTQSFTNVPITGQAITGPTINNIPDKSVFTSQCKYGTNPYKSCGAPIYTPLSSMDAGSITVNFVNGFCTNQVSLD